MPTITDYLIKLSVSLAIVFLFYQFVLRNLTFYKFKITTSQINKQNNAGKVEINTVPL
ncbi:MAG: hypothetical protein IT249_10975 [Chitinophagaceae bacterium]|nr:hypothetical protein [Chitinophagaceae bacterium]